MLKIFSALVLILFHESGFSQHKDVQDFEQVAVVKETLEIGDFEKAQQSLDSILSLNPTNIYALQLKGSIYANFKNDYPRAIAYYKKYEDIHPHNGLNLANIGKNYCKLDSLSIGREYISKAYGLDPNNEYILLQYAYFVIDDIDEKIKIYEAAILNAKLKIESNSYVHKETLRDIHNNIGYNLYLKKEFLKSSIFLLDGLEYGSENADHLNNLGNALQRVNLLEQAIKYYNKALALDPKKTFSLNGKANTYLRMKVIDSACVYWKKTLENGYEFKQQWRAIWDIEDPKLQLSKFCNE